MIELAIQIKNEVGTDKISVEVLPRDPDANIIEKDVMSGLFPHVVDLLNGLLGGEGFRKTENLVKEVPVPPQESRIVDKNGVPSSIPMNEEYLLKKGLVEPVGGDKPISRDSAIIIE
jgi:hypothetical protein